MPIYYALVAKDKSCVLSQYTSYQGDFQKYATELMQRI